MMENVLSDAANLVALFKCCDSKHILLVNSG